MRFDLTDEQRAVQQVVRELCDAHAGALEGGDRGRRLWTELAKSGWTQMPVPQQYGGHGAGLLELSLVLEELGRSLAAGPFLGHAAAAVLVTSCGDDRQRARWLPGLASGGQRAALGQATGGHALLVDAPGATLGVIAGDEVVAVIDPIPGNAEVVEALDITRSLHRIGRGAEEALHGEVGEGLDRAEVLLAAELVGVGHRAMELAVDHAKSREQFGRAIGAYQAVSHKCADMLVEVESARSAVLAAAWTADHEPERLPFAASVAKVTAVSAAWRVSASSLQVHGGMGFTWEHPIHRYLRRAAAGAHLLRSVERHLDRVARLSGLDGVNIPAA
jgi:alkylation response protein AidB-like acyl-CoA dehydrogenase